MQPNRDNIVDVAVVGAGAAGLAAAIFAARRMPDRRIVALDGARKLGAKILVAGGGRCNVTNRAVRPADFFGGSSHVVKRVLAAFDERQTVDFFAELGVALHEEEHGKLFPDTNRARTVLDALLAEAERRGVRILADHKVTAIERIDGGFELHTPMARISARRVVLATGGLSLPKTGSDGSGYALATRLGHTLVETTPGLVPLRLEGGFHAPLSGIAHEVELCVRVAGDKPVRMRGALLWTHFGASGPVVLDASRHWHRARKEGKAVTVCAHLLPGLSEADVDALLLKLTYDQPRLFLHNALATKLPARVADATLAALGIDGRTPLAHLAKADRRRLCRAMVEWPLPVIDSRGYGFAEVTAGGVPLSEIDPSTMASRRCPGLFLVGEILDVDGRIGGFNFQWAWSSGWVAGRGLAISSGSENSAAAADL